MSPVDDELLHLKEFSSQCTDVLLVVRVDGTLIFANPAASELFDEDVETLRGQSFLERVQANDRARTREALSSSAETIKFESHHSREGGSLRVVEWKGRTNPDKGLIYLIGTDITDRARIEEELRDSELRGRALFDNAAQGIIAVDPDGRIRTVNPMAEKLFGYPREELLGKGIEILMPKVLRSRHERFRENFFEAPKTRPMGQGLDLVGLKKDGTEFPVEISLSHVTTKHGPSSVAFINDIGERKRAAKEKERLEHRLEHATKMEAVGRLAGGIAHDFNNLLTALSGFSEIVLDELPETHPLYEGARETYKTCQRSASLVRRLLAVSRRQILQPQVLDLNTKIHEIEKMLRSVLGEDIELTVKLDPELGFVLADESQIEQVILNLVVNARDAMPQGGQLTIHTTLLDIDDAFLEHHVGIKSGPHVLITVSDTGFGMDAATLEHIFEPFFTTKEKGKGTGLGLATVYGIVQQSKGNIWVYSEPGQGTTFKIYLPQVSRGGHREGETSDSAEGMKGSETILVVEDENTVRLVTVSNLRKAGYSVLEARNGEEALQIASESDHPIQLVLTDVVMPRMNGPELVARLTKRLPDVKVVYMSGHADDALVHHGVIEEGLAFLEKPFTRDDLHKKVREALDAD